MFLLKVIDKLTLWCYMDMFVKYGKCAKTYFMWPSSYPTEIFSQQAWFFYLFIYLFLLNRSHSADTPLSKVSHMHLPGLPTSPLNNSQLIILRECSLTCRTRPRSLDRSLSQYFCVIISPCLSLSLLQRIHLTVQIFTYLNL